MLGGFPCGISFMQTRPEGQGVHRGPQPVCRPSPHHTPLCCWPPPFSLGCMKDPWLVGIAGLAVWPLMLRPSLVAFRLSATAWPSRLWPRRESVALTEEILDKGSHSAPKGGRGQGLACRVLIRQAVEIWLQSTLPPLDLLWRPFELTIPPHSCSRKLPHSPLMAWAEGSGKAGAYVWGAAPHSPSVALSVSVQC